MLSGTGKYNFCTYGFNLSKINGEKTNLHTGCRRSYYLLYDWFYKFGFIFSDGVKQKTFTSLIIKIEGEGGTREGERNESWFVLFSRQEKIRSLSLVGGWGTSRVPSNATQTPTRYVPDWGRYEDLPLPVRDGCVALSTTSCQRKGRLVPPLTQSDRRDL